MAKTPQRPRYSRAAPSMVYDPMADARTHAMHHVERELDRGLVRQVRCDHSPSGRPEIRGAADTSGWNRYGYSDGDGNDTFVVGRSTVSQNREPR